MTEVARDEKSGRDTTASANSACSLLPALLAWGGNPVHWYA